MEDSTIEFYENKCCICHRHFWQKRKGRLRRTCSDACRQALYRRRHRKQVRLSKQEELYFGDGNLCPVCGEAIQSITGGRPRKTCSDRCRKRMWRELNPRCLYCGTRFPKSPTQPLKVYCGEACRDKAETDRRRYKRQEERRQSMHYSRSLKPLWQAYRRERIDADGTVQVVREREADPDYWDGEWNEDDPNWEGYIAF